MLLSGCDTLTQAANTVDKANLCVDALQAASFTPDENNPELTAANAEKSATELRDLADQAQDVTLRDALNAMSTKISDLSVAGLTVDDMQNYLQQKADLYQTLSNACA